MFTVSPASEHFAVFGDATFIHAGDRFSDPLAEPPARQREFTALLGTSALTSALPDCPPAAPVLVPPETSTSASARPTLMLVHGTTPAGGPAIAGERAA